MPQMVSAFLYALLAGIIFSIGMGAAIFAPKPLWTMIMVQVGFIIGIIITAALRSNG